MGFCNRLLEKKIDCTDPSVCKGDVLLQKIALQTRQAIERQEVCWVDLDELENKNEEVLYNVISLSDSMDNPAPSACSMTKYHRRLLSDHSTLRAASTFCDTLIVQQ